MRILVLSASVGAGHLRAAQAVEKAAREIVPQAQVKHVDVLTLTNAAFRRLYARTYLDLVNQAPHVLGYFYDVLDRPPLTGKYGDRLRLLMQKLNLGKFLYAYAVRRVLTHSFEGASDGEVSATVMSGFDRASVNED